MEITASLVRDLREASGAGMMDCKKALNACDGDLEKAMDYLRENGIAKAEKKSGRIAAEGLAQVFVEGNKAVILEVNSETDFVSKNEEFTDMIQMIGSTVLKSEVKDLESALKLQLEEGTIEDLIVSKTAKIGEKLSLRRLEVVTKNDSEVFGSYLHLGGKIAVLTVLAGTDEEVAKDVAMQAAAMKPDYVQISDVPEDVVAREREVLKEQSMNEGKPADIAEKMVEGRLKKFYKEICLVEQAFIKDGDKSVGEYVSEHDSSIVSMIRYEVGEGMEHRSDNFAEEVMSQVKGND
ncbi:MAG: elongation factor Ts [Bacilli bacterium]|jgi:elongation factor Ts|nr:elongation factor Ts [Bacilli bacterium]